MSERGESPVLGSREDGIGDVGMVEEGEGGWVGKILSATTSPPPLPFVKSRKSEKEKRRTRKRSQKTNSKSLKPH